MHMQALTRPEVVRLPAANETAPLHLADAAAVAQALAPDLPVHCFSPATLAATARTYLDGFPGEVSYAVKANSGRHVLVTLAEAGIHVFDVASPAEMEAVREVAPTAELHYHNPIKGRREIIAAAEVYGVRRFAADCVAEIDKIAAVLASLGIAVSEAEIAVRFRLPRQGMSAHDFSSKFGVGPDEAAELLRYASGKGFGVVLTFHPGSQCTNPEGYSRHIEAAAVAARTAGVRLAALNVGGGFPARYLDLAAPEPEAYFAAIATAAAEAFGADFVPKLECEPGRGLVATSTSLLARVKLVRAEHGEVFLNDGIYGSLLEVAQAPALQPAYRVIRPGGTVAAEMRDFVVYGPTCDPLDRLPNRLRLPADLAEDDYLELGPIGAYGTATSTRFNGYGAAEVVTVEQTLGA